MKYQASESVPLLIISRVPSELINRHAAFDLTCHALPPYSLPFPFFARRRQLPYHCTHQLRRLNSPGWSHILGHCIHQLRALWLLGRARGLNHGAHQFGA